MKRTYVDIINDYYDLQDELLEDQDIVLSDSDLRRALRGKQTIKRLRLKD